MSDLLQSSGANYAAMSTGQIVLAFVLSLCMTSAVAAVYIWTYRGMSYTRSYVHAVIIGGLVATMIMLAVRNNLAAGLGIMGSLAMVRFRTAMRDPRDMIFMFAGLGAGVACGMQVYKVAFVGTGFFCATAALITLLEFGATRQYDGLLRFRGPLSPEVQAKVSDLIHRRTKRFALVTMRELKQGQEVEQAYQVRLRQPKDRLPLMRELESITELADITLHFQDQTVEI